MIAPKVAGSDTNVAFGERATRVSAGNPAECHLLARMGMKRTADEIARVAVCVAIAAWLAGCPMGTLGDPMRAAPDRSPASGPAARPASAAPVFPPAASAAGLAVAPSAARVTYVSSDQPGGNTGIMWGRFGSAGELLAEALVAEVTYSYYGPSAAVAFGDDTLVSVVDQQVSSLSIARVGPDGQILTRPYDILRAPPFGIGYHEMVRRGPDVIVSWLSLGGPAPWVGLARITP